MNTATYADFCPIMPWVCLHNHPKNYVKAHSSLITQKRSLNFSKSQYELRGHFVTQSNWNFISHVTRAKKNQKYCQKNPKFFDYFCNVATFRIAN